MHRILIALAASAVLLLRHVHAQTPEEIERYKKMTIFQVGVATALNYEPYRGAEDLQPNALVIPFYVYNKNNLTLAGPNISYRFWRPLDVQLSAEARYRFQNYGEDDSPFLEGMGDRNGTFEIGMQAQKRFDRLRLQAASYVDVLGQHDGFEGLAQATFEVGNGRMISLRPAAGVTFQSQNIMQYYYGVTFDRARQNMPVGDGTFMDRSAYFPEEAIIPFAGAELRIRLSRRLALSGQVRSAFLPSEITDSPLVDQTHRTSAFFGLSYGISGPGIIKDRWL